MSYRPAPQANSIRTASGGKNSGASPNASKNNNKDRKRQQRDNWLPASPPNSYAGHVRAAAPGDDDTSDTTASSDEPSDEPNQKPQNPPQQRPQNAAPQSRGGPASGSSTGFENRVSTVSESTDADATKFQ